MNDVKDLWLKFNEYENKLATALGRTRNIVGEYAEYLAHKHYGGKLLGESSSSADIETSDGIRYQVKASKVKDRIATKLSIIRRWDFDFLVVIIFDENGMVKKALEVPVDIAKEYGVSDSYQNGWTITTSKKFFNDERSKNITSSLSILNA